MFVCMDLMCLLVFVSILDHELVVEAIAGVQIIEIGRNLARRRWKTGEGDLEKLATIRAKDMGRPPTHGHGSAVDLWVWVGCRPMYLAPMGANFSGMDLWCS